MKNVINGLLYDTSKMTVLCCHDSYNNNNYCGDESIRVTSGGNYAFVVTANGQDLHRESSITAITKDEIASYIDGWRLNNDEVAALSALGVLAEA
jgi:hypothetical protein